MRRSARSAHRARSFVVPVVLVMLVVLIIIVMLAMLVMRTTMIMMTMMMITIFGSQKPAKKYIFQGFPLVTPLRAILQASWTHLQAVLDVFGFLMIENTTCKKSQFFKVFRSSPNWMMDDARNVPVH